MAEPEDHTLRLLREIRGEVRSLQESTDSGFAQVNKRIDSLQQAMNGESVLGRYAAAEVEERLSAIESRLTAIDQDAEDGNDHVR